MSLFIANGTTEGGCWAEAIVCDRPSAVHSLSLSLRITTLVSLLFGSVNYSAGRRGHVKVDDDGSLSPLPRPEPREPGGYLALLGRAALLGGPLFCRLFLFFYGFSQHLFLQISFQLVAFAIDCLWRYRVKSRSRFSWESSIIIF